MLRALVRGQKLLYRAVVCIVTLATYLSVSPDQSVHFSHVHKDITVQVSSNTAQIVVMR